MRKVVVIGAGGHSRSVCDIILQDSENEIIGLIDSPDTQGFWGLTVLGNDEILPEIYRSGKATHIFVAIGNNRKRRNLMEHVKTIGFELINAISSHAFISPHARIGTGIAIMPGAIIGPNAFIGSGSIINTNASVDHDDMIGECCHIAPGCAICGTVMIGKEAFIGVGAKIIDGITVGEGTVVGAGASVIRDLPPRCTAVGVPARIIKQQ